MFHPLGDKSGGISKKAHVNSGRKWDMTCIEIESDDDPAANAVFLERPVV